MSSERRTISSVGRVMVNVNEAKALVSEAFYELRASTPDDKPIQRRDGPDVTPEELDRLEQIVLELMGDNRDWFNVDYLPGD